ncbi:amino-acid N-acetyltransferase [Leucobacter insecticola]|uniref:Amino-acid N-acetyltransferase n=1 Tax=Leucobacter insecticola TaxID=2714934 RepID=A0A6G8FLF0_9MICO|nr:amino-acid N-acetyltransferase [Leucobacter insecticola]QIM17207.1 amino-acid N-acetyltransferase [Leucobacter insecticola]
MTETTEIQIRPMRTADVPRMARLMEPLVERRILLGKDLVELYGAVPEFLVATVDDDRVIGYGAVHVMWDQLGEVRTLGVSDEYLGRGVGRRLLQALEDRARQLGLTQLFCLTFETEFFGRNGFEEMSENASLVAADVYAELLRSNDEGVAEFLNLARVKPNTLGNTRMLKRL